MGIAAGIVTVLIVWCIANTWDPEVLEEELIDELEPWVGVTVIGE